MSKVRKITAPVFFSGRLERNSRRNSSFAKHVNNPDLLVQLYGPGQDSLKKSNHPQPIDDPFYVWSGLCLGNWMVTLKHKTSNVDLTGFAKISWRSKQAGLRQLRITMKLADGTWLVSDQFDDATKDWRIREFNVQDITWYKLDAKSVVEIGPLQKLDLKNGKRNWFYRFNARWKIGFLLPPRLD
ncbi:MAG: hypothetical protein IPF54_26675 [Draconibacterium sp.]|nr:hypothetical protein [Draconibacterium sp.]